MAEGSSSLNVAVVGWHTHNSMFDAIGADLARAGHRIVRHADREAFAKAHNPLAGADVLLCAANFPLTRAMFAGAPRLRAVVSAITGVEGVDQPAATDHAIVVANAQTPDNVTGMAEATVLLILAALYDFNGTQRLLREFLPRPDPLRAHQLRGKTVGMIGLGKIGREAARLLAPFGAKLQYAARRDADLAGLPPMQRADLDTLMATSDIVVVLASLNAETRGLVNAARLKLMKPTAILINVARGAIVDEAAIVDALARKAIAGAALDCFEVEPLPKDSPLRALPNVILTPHMIGHTYEAHHSLEVATRDNLDCVFAGKPPRYVVNPAVLPAWTAKWGTPRG
ncbi:MAG: D-3-phosphoglycerate dehydrogenase [Alphaproteobacteria bacterium]|nr:D-3-phosphoglycerate dehydrogenase [Alphaproteobacteria bacterium]